ncbi:hypothetical protein VN97_g1119 [Penicillium thymicola]|uniref:Uncharacterized protein n=1 Tax=Penicillium thymicola TaxID=293382 RepID=A0AAI9TSV5_PENTH|nr:hypothetical protein VN97_g1119 [Penicillium thymicola]
MLIATPETRLEVGHALELQGLKRTGDEKNLVGWAAMNPRHPRNWSNARKAYDVSIIIFLEFYTTAVSTSGATAARNAQKQFGIGETLSVFLYISTKWVFYFAAIVTGILAVLLLTIRESRPTVLLTQEVRHLRHITGDYSLQALNPDRVPDIRSFARNFAFRPAQLLFTEPIIAAVSIVCGISTGLIYLFTDILPGVYESFGLTSTQASLPFLALGFGFLPNIGTRFLEYRKTARRRERGEPVIPEHKLTGYIIAAPVLMIALWWFAWTIPPAVHVHYFASVVPLFLTGFAINEFGIVLVGYMSDSYRSYSASGFAALGLVRCVLAASFPLFSGRMFSQLGPNGAMCVLAGLATGFCILSPVLRIYGERLRKSSKFAAHCVDVDAENTFERT